MILALNSENRKDLPIEPIWYVIEENGYMINLGIDVGSISVKVAVIGDEADKEILENIVSESQNFFSLNGGDNSPRLNGKSILVSKYKRIGGMPVLSLVVSK